MKNKYKYNIKCKKCRKWIRVNDDKMFKYCWKCGEFIDWRKVKHFSFVTSTRKHKRRKVIPVNKLKECHIRQYMRKQIYL